LGATDAAELVLLHGSATILVWSKCPTSVPSRLHVHTEPLQFMA
jgi:hypothetical protein